MKLSISEARARLPELAQSVMDSPGRAIIIEHRDRKERVVLIAETHFRWLEAMVQNLGKQKTEAFTLAGSIASDLTDEGLEAALAALRQEASAAAASKLLDLLEE